MRDLERSFLYGERYEDLGTRESSSIIRRTTGGVNRFISTNSTNAAGALTESEFEGFLRTVFRYGSNTKYLFCAPLILSVISLWAQGKLQTFPKDIKNLCPCKRLLNRWNSCKGQYRGK